MKIANKLIIKLNIHNPNDIDLLQKNKLEISALKRELTKIKSNINLLIKDSENTKYNFTNNDQKIIDKYNSLVPKEYQTKDINVALHSYKSFVDAQNTQKLKELIF